MPPWLAEVRRFRAEVLHDDGLRPAYRAPDGTFCDDDPSDLFAHHVVARLDGDPIATLRLVALATTDTGVCERLLGAAALDGVVADLGGARATAWEAAGWAVRQDRRAGSMGPRIVAAGWAVARSLGLDLCVGAVGTRYGQLYRVLSAGFRRVPGLEPVAVPDLRDEVQVVHATYDMLRPGFRALVEQATDQLRWAEASPTWSNRRTS